MYNSSEIKWIKNVKAESGNIWAYDDKKIGDTFILGLPKRSGINVSKPHKDDLIVLFQGNNNPRGTFLTHLVTPINDIEIDTGIPDFPKGRYVGLIAKADPICSIPTPNNLNFKAPNRGKFCSINLIKNRENSSHIQELFIQQLLWELFQNNINPDLEDLFSFINSPTYDDESSFLEGQEIFDFRKHRYYERNSAIVERKKQLAKDHDEFYCEICNFDFSKVYPDIGNGFIECHHRVLISVGGVRRTTLNDLALVCSNCHSMLHRTIRDSLLSIEELKNIIVQIQ